MTWRKIPLKGKLWKNSREMAWVSLQREPRWPRWYLKTMKYGADKAGQLGKDPFTKIWKGELHKRWTHEKGMKVCQELWSWGQVQQLTASSYHLKDHTGEPLTHGFSFFLQEIILYSLSSPNHFIVHFIPFGFSFLVTLYPCKIQQQMSASLCLHIHRISEALCFSFSSSSLSLLLLLLSPPPPSLMCVCVHVSWPIPGIWHNTSVRSQSNKILCHVNSVYLWKWTCQPVPAWW